MSPTIVMRSGQPFLALGSPGGSTIITTVLQILFDRLDRDDRCRKQSRIRVRGQRKHNGDERRACVPLERVADAAGGARPYFSNGGEIGAATESSSWRRSVLAAAEPVRRGGGSALVETRAVARPS
jgi:gamma-glutamyltranspeptidase/glutathione hydrolase